MLKQHCGSGGTLLGSWQMGLIRALLGGVALLTSPRLHASDLEQARVYPVTENPAEFAASDRVGAEPSFTARRFVLQARTGIATSVGFVGVLGEVNLHDRLAVNAGVGTNFYGWSPAFGVRLRPLLFTSKVGTRRDAIYAITLEGSLSRAAYGEPPKLPVYCIEACQPSPRLETRYVSWGQVELGFEMLAAERYQFLGSFGWSKMLGDPSFSCVREATGERFDCSHDTRITPHVFVISFAAGYAF